jgi:PhnB protein
MATNYIPAGQHTLVPYLTVRNAPAAIEYYKKAFGAAEAYPPMLANGKIMHAALKIGDSTFMLSEEFPESGCSTSPQTLKGTAVAIHMYVPDVDATIAQAVKAGATVKMPATDMFWGDRYGLINDPFGHAWSISTHKEDLTPEQIQKRGNEAFASFAKK